MVLQLTSTTAPGHIFSSQLDLSEHYKSNFHKYNLKRKQNGLIMLNYNDFIARSEAIHSLQVHGNILHKGFDHLKNTKRKEKKQNDTMGNIGSPSILSKLEEYCRPLKTNNSRESTVEINLKHASLQSRKNKEIRIIDPCQSLFDRKVFQNIEENVEYMEEKYGFFLPDREYLLDIEGFIGYCTEKIKLGHYCLYCQKNFKSYRGCQEHMISTQHTMIKYESGVDREEYDIFYDFTLANENFFHDKKEPRVYTVENNYDYDDIHDQEYTFKEYEKMIRTYGFNITSLGELIFPNGRVIGHRCLSRYYKQRFVSPRNNIAVQAAKRAANEKMILSHFHSENQLSMNRKFSTLARIQEGINLRGQGRITGRMGRGILLRTNSFTSSEASWIPTYTTLSLYRYKAAIKKCRRGERYGKSLHEQTMLNMNKMDKRTNRLINNVSVAHAPR